MVEATPRGLRPMTPMHTSGFQIQIKHTEVTQPPSFFPETSPFRSEVVSGVQCLMKNYY